MSVIRGHLIIDIGSWVRAPESIHDVDDSMLDKAFVEKCDRKIVCFVGKAIQ
jgi:hypothetical protein